MATGEEVAFPAGTKVRVSHLAGPCLPATVIRRNRTTYTVAFDFPGYPHREPHYSVHDTPCVCCMDHPQTSYTYGSS